MRSLGVSVYLGLALALGAGVTFGKPPETAIAFESQRVDAEILGDSAMERMLAPYRERVAAYSAEVVIEATEPIAARRSPESAMGNALADALRGASLPLFGVEADIGVANFGGLRRDLPKGPITVGLITEMSPFDNFVVLLEMRGAEVRRLAEAIGRTGGEPISGLELRIRSSDKSVSASLAGKPIQADRIYRVATMDYLADTDRRLFPDGSVLSRKTAGVTQRDVLIDLLKAKAARGETLTNRIEGRIEFNE